MNHFQHLSPFCIQKSLFLGSLIDLGQFLTALIIPHGYCCMDEIFQDNSTIQDFEADFP